MSLQVPQIPFIRNVQGAGFRRHERSGKFKGLQRLIKDTKSYVFVPLEDDFERQNQLRMIQLEQQSIGGDIEALYSGVNELRQEERKEMIQRGYLDDENSKRTLDEAISFRGTCVDMCPTFERVRRTRQNNVNVNEKDPSSGVISRSRAIKSFARPAAGQEPPLPSDVRPPLVLVKTLDFIIENLLDKIPDTQSFIWDRTRSIRQDFTFQNYFGPETVDCNERIVRIHIMSLHIMANSTVDYSQQQELEQLEKSLKTLSEMYDEYRKKGFPQPPNEAEFRAYHLLLKINDPDLERQCEILPSSIYEHKLVQLAFRVRRVFSIKDIPKTANLYTSLFDLILSPEVPFLFACLLEVYFNNIRFKSLRAIINANHSKFKNLTLTHLLEVLRFPDLSSLKKFLEFYNIKWNIDNNGNESIDIISASTGLNHGSSTGSIPKTMKSAYDPRINSKANGMSRSQIINSGYRNNLQISASALSTSNITQSNRMLASFANDMRTPNGALSNGQSTSIFGASNKSFSFIGNQNNVIDETKRLEQEKLEGEERAKQLGKQQEEERLKLEIQKKQELIRKQKEREEAIKRQKEEELRRQQEIQRQQEEARLRELERIKQQEEEKRRKEQERQLQILKEQERRRQEEIAARQEARAKQLATELYESFLDEIVYTTTLEVIADKFRKEHLEKKVSKVIFSEAKKCKAIYDAKQRKKDEVLKTSRLFGLVPNSSYFSKRYNIMSDFASNFNDIMGSRGIQLLQAQNGSDDSFKELDSVQSNQLLIQNHKLEENDNAGNESTFILPEEDKFLIQSKNRQDALLLWQPLDLSKFVQACSSRITNKGETLNLSVLVVVSDWGLPSAKWLKSKLQLLRNDQLHTYSNTVAHGNLALTFGGYHESYLRNTNILIFECGFAQNRKNYTQEEGRAKLLQDAQILIQFLDLINNKSAYKYQILLLFWSNNSLNFLEEDIYELLKVEHVKEKYRQNLVNIVFCPLDLAKKDPATLNKRLSKCLSRVAKHFSAESKTQQEALPSLQNGSARNVRKRPTSASQNGDTLVRSVHTLEAKPALEVPLEQNDAEKPLLEQHPYFKKHQHFNLSFALKKPKLNSKHFKFLLPSTTGTKRVASTDRNCSFKRQNASQHLFSLTRENSVLDIPLAHSLMAQHNTNRAYDQSNVSVNPGLTTNFSFHGHNDNRVASSTSNNSFSLLDSRFNRYGNLNKTDRSRNVPVFPPNTRKSSLLANSSFAKPSSNVYHKNANENTNGKARGVTADVDLGNISSNLLELKSLISNVKAKYKRSQS